jgi:hypothetical protein
VEVQPKATGYCYKTTFGDWLCYMNDSAGHIDGNIRQKVAPPKGGKNVGGPIPGSLGKTYGMA